MSSGHSRWGLSSLTWSFRLTRALLVTSSGFTSRFVTSQPLHSHTPKHTHTCVLLEESLHSRTNIWRRGGQVATRCSAWAQPSHSGHNAHSVGPTIPWLLVGSRCAGLIMWLTHTPGAVGWLLAHLHCACFTHHTAQVTGMLRYADYKINIINLWCVPFPPSHLECVCVCVFVCVFLCSFCALCVSASLYLVCASMRRVFGCACASSVLPCLYVHASMCCISLRMCLYHVCAFMSLVCLSASRCLVCAWELLQGFVLSRAHLRFSSCCPTKSHPATPGLTWPHPVSTGHTQSQLANLRLTWSRSVSPGHTLKHGQ